MIKCYKNQELYIYSAIKIICVPSAVEAVKFRKLTLEIF